MKQPDLNWRNPAVRAAMFDVLRFWFERGVDGFRIDVLWLLIKDELFRDNPPNPDYRPGIDQPVDSQLQVYNADRPEMMALIAQLRAVADEYPERVLIGEIYLPIPSSWSPIMGWIGSGVHLPYNFQLILLPWDAATIAAAVAAYEAALPAGAWPNWVLGNHDQPRIASRVGAAQARVAAMLLLTLRGTPTLYYGDELGMPNVPIPPERQQDPQGLDQPGVGRSRDPERTPMQWDRGSSAGFSTGTPWLPLPDDYATINVAAEEGDPASILTLYRRLIALRRAAPALVAGAYVPVSAVDDLFLYRREGADGRYLIALNLGHQPREVVLDGAGRVALSTHLDREGDAAGATLALRPDEGVIVALSD